jgi:hypothetical protein
LTRRADVWHFIVAVLALSVCAARVSAQGSDIIQSSSFTFEVGAWPTLTTIGAAGERNGLVGTPIDFNTEFGLKNQVLVDLRGAFRPTRRQRLSLHYIPIRYEMTATLARPILYAGVTFPAGVSTTGIVSWQAFGGSYQYDVVARPHLRVGLVGEIDRTNVQVRLYNGSNDELTSSSVATIPAGGLTFDLGLSVRTALYAKVLGFYVPDRTDLELAYGGHYLDAEAQVRWSVGRRVTAQAGYRVIDIRHLGQADSGTMRLHGPTVSLAITVGRAR